MTGQVLLGSVDRSQTRMVVKMRIMVRPLLLGSKWYGCAYWLVSLQTIQVTDVNICLGHAALRIMNWTRLGNEGLENQYASLFFRLIVLYFHIQGCFSIRGNANAQGSWVQSGQ